MGWKTTCMERTTEMQFFLVLENKRKKLKASHVNIFISSIIPVWITADILESYPGLVSCCCSYNHEYDYQEKENRKGFLAK